MKHASSELDRVGIGLRARTVAELTERAQAISDGGFHHVWVYDSPRFVEAYTALAYCGLTIPNVSVGTAVTNPETRHPVVVAQAFATLSHLLEGRVVCGIGLGDSAVKFMGDKPPKFAEFARKVDIIRTLLHGESVDIGGRSYSLPDPPSRAPLILIAAEGPKTYEYAGAVADGAIISPGGSERVVRYALKQIRDAAVRADRDPDSLYTVAWTHAAIAESVEAAVQELRPQVSRTLFKAAVRIPHQVFGLEEPAIDSELRARALDLVSRQDSEYQLAEELAAALGFDLVQELTLVGTADDCSRKLRALQSTGVSQVIVNIHGSRAPSSIREFGGVLTATNEPRGSTSQ